MTIKTAYGILLTDKGGTFCLEGDYFVRSFPCKNGPSFPINELPQHLEGLKIVSISGDESPEESNTIIDDGIDEECFDIHQIDELNAYFEL